MVGIGVDWLRAFCALAALLLFAGAAAAEGLPCHALAPAGAPLAASAVASLPFDCGSDAGAFRDRWLWMRLLPPADGAERDLVVRPTRVDALRVVVAYADGGFATDEVRAGAFGDHWSMDNRVSFDLPARATPVVAVYLGANRLRFADTLSPQLMDTPTARRTSTIDALLIGASLALLFASFVYNGFRLVAQGQRALAGHVLWALLLFIWGLLVSQAVLVVFPGIAGTWSARLATVVACAAIAAATWLFAAMVEVEILGRGIKRLIVVTGLGPFLLSLITIRELGGRAGVMENLINAAAVTPILVVTLFAGVAIARGSRAAREFAFAWILPMAAVLTSSLLDISRIPGASGQVSVLVASALQTILLSMTMTMRLGQVRAERDRARVLGAEYQRLALTDPMTGLLNRRGFVEAVERLLGTPEPVGLALLDLDYFKAINDSFGHGTGDDVLVEVGAALRSVCPARGIAGRLGGEEFGIAVPGLTGPALADHAEAIRLAVAGIELAGMLDERRVACSIGVADTQTAGDASFDLLFRAADRAMYDAKRRGRDRVVVARRSPRAVGV